MNSTDVLILGAGVAGLAAAHRARELGLEALILEARSTAGGILDSFVVEGFTFDNAVHLSFATEKPVRDVFDHTEFLNHVPQAFCFENHRWLKYPVQNNLYPLSAEEKTAIISSFVGRKVRESSDDYWSWLVSEFGEEFAERYSRKYTRKYWGYEPEQLSTTWIDQRIRSADLNEMLFGSFTSETPHYYYAKEMRYPTAGGYKSFISGLIEQASIEFDRRVSKIDTENRLVTCADGFQYAYRRLVSSLPLPIMPSLLSSVPRVVEEAAKQLTWTRVGLVSFGIHGVQLDRLWFYIYDEDLLASRAYSPSVKAASNAPEGYSSIQFEIYVLNTASMPTESQAIESCLIAIERLGIAPKDSVRFLDYRVMPWGNVAFPLGMEDSRDAVLGELQSRGVKSVGRFGEWDYLWSNQSFLSGYNSVEN